MNKLPALRRQNRYLIAATVVDVDDDMVLSARSLLITVSHLQLLLLYCVAPIEKYKQKMSCNQRQKILA
jgi:hypothetical protein